MSCFNFVFVFSLNFYVDLCLNKFTGWYVCDHFTILQISSLNWLFIKK